MVIYFKVQNLLVLHFDYLGGNKMKRKIIISLLAVMLLVSVGCQSEKENVKSENIGTFKTVDLENNEVTEEIFKKNDLTLVNVFSSSCNPCMQELPDLAELSNELKEKKVGIVGLNIDMDMKGNPDEDSRKIVSELLKKKNVDMKVIFSDINLTEKVLAKIDTIPYTFFVDKEGNIVGKSYLGTKSKDDWKKIIDEEFNR